MSMFRHDSPAMEAISTAADYVILNILCLLLCLPVLTAGASLTAKYDVGMRMARGEEPSAAAAFFKSFRTNFAQATAVWGILAAVFAFLSADWYLVFWNGNGSGSGAPWPLALRVLLVVVTFAAGGVFFAVFPLIARFRMRTGEALRGAFVFALLHPFRVGLALFLIALPYFVSAWYMEWALLIWILCTGAALYYNSRMFVREFSKIEEGIGV